MLSVTPVHLLDGGSDLGKRVLLTRKTRPGASSHVILDPGRPTPRRWKRLRSPSSEGEGVRWACLAIFFLDLGLGDFCTGYAWNLPPEGVPAGQSSRRDQCTGTGPFFIGCMPPASAYEPTHVLSTPSAPPPPFPPSPFPSATIGSQLTLGYLLRISAMERTSESCWGSEQMGCKLGGQFTVISAHLPQKDRRLGEFETVLAEILDFMHT